MHPAIFVLSTGRCGTQWLASKLGGTYSDLLAVEHEPLHDRYQARRLLGIETPAALDPASADVVLRHLDRIETCLETRPYLECGHPCWSALPFLTRRLAGRISIIHLVRHPIPTALSWLTHSAYEIPILPHLREKVLLSPFDDGVAFPEYRERWVSMSAFEKCLYYWAEVNALGLRLERDGGALWLRVSFEEMFGPAGLRRLLHFLNLPERPSMAEAGRDRIDEHQFKTASPLPDLGVITSHPRIVDVAGRLGYSVGWNDLRGLSERYVWPGF